MSQSTIFAFVTTSLTYGARVAKQVESASVLYTDLFYSDVLRVLRPGGRFSQQMNTKDKRYESFQKQTKETWLKLGFIEVMEWEENLVNYGGTTVLMGGVKGNH